MKKLVINLVLLCFTSTIFAQYQVGVEVHEVIYEGEFSRLAECSPEEDVNIGVDDELLNFVTGLELKLIVTEINMAQGALVGQNGILFVNDTLDYNLNEEFHSFYMNGDGNFKFSILAMGVPQVPGEAYPCFLEGFMTQTECNIGYQIVPDYTATFCEVLEGTVGTQEVENWRDKIMAYPNPTNGNFTLLNNSNYSIQSIAIYNGFGDLSYYSRVVRSSESIMVEFSPSQSGLYFIKVETRNGQLNKKIFVE